MRLVILLTMTLLPGCTSSRPKSKAKKEPVASPKPVARKLPKVLRSKPRMTEKTSQAQLCTKIVDHMVPALKSLKKHLRRKKSDTLPMRMSRLGAMQCRSKYRRRIFRLVARSVNQHSWRLGVLLPLDGPHAALGESVLQGLRAATKAAGKKFDEVFLVRNTRGNRQQALQAYADLVFNHEVSMVIGGVTKEEAATLADYSRPLLLPTLILNREQELIEDSPYAFKVYPSEKHLAHTLAKAARARGIRSVSFLRPSNGKSDAFLQHLQEGLEQQGSRVVQDVPYERDDFPSHGASHCQDHRYRHQRPSRGVPCAV